MDMNDYTYLNAHEVWRAMFNKGLSLHDQLCFNLIDNVKIIRCKDCKKRNTNWCPMYFAHFEYNEEGELEWYEFPQETDDDFFCAMGELKDAT